MKLAVGRSARARRPLHLRFDSSVSRLVPAHTECCTPGTVRRPGKKAPLKLSPRFATAAGLLAVGLVTAGTAAAVQASPPLPAPTGVEAANAAAAQAAESFVSSRPSVLHASS